MPSAPKIRKELLHILENSILPTLRQGEILQALAAPPFDFSQLQTHTVREEFLPDNDEGPLQVLRNWPEEDLIATRGINFSFCYAGSMHKKIGITEKVGNEIMRQGQPRPAGITIIELPSPSIMVSSSFTAREASSIQPILDQDTSRTCSVTLTRNEITVFHSSRSPGQSSGSHHLAVQDPISYQLWKLYYETLCQQTDLVSAQSILQAAYQRLHHQLSHTRPVLSHSSWLNPATDLQPSLTHTQSKHQALCHDLIDYIHNHLHLPLSVSMLAQHFNVSAFHLNRVFRASQNTTVMRYVTELRVKAAQPMLSGQHERINEIAQLVGFNSAANFCTVFRRHTGLTPNQYRKRHTKIQK